MEKPKIVFFGNERLATGVATSVPTLTALIEAGYEICAVVSNYEKGLSRISRKLEIKDITDKHGIPILLPDKPKEIFSQLKDYKADVGVLVAYGKIVPQEIIDIFPYGIINVHPSLLPLHRGPTPIESAIIDGDSKTGVSIMSLVKAMDAGPVYGFSEIELNGNESKQELADTLSNIGASMIAELLPDIVARIVVAQPQDNSKATYDNLIDKRDGIIDFTKSSQQLEREIRAFSEWPKSRTQLAGIDVIITMAKPSTNRLSFGEVSIIDKQLFIGCSKGSLEILALKPSGKSEMSAASFIVGYGQKL